MTDADKREQRISFTYGNLALSNPLVTRERVEQVVYAADVAQVLATYDGSTSVQVHAILRMVTPENVRHVLAALPDTFRPAFVEWMQEFYGELRLPPVVSIGGDIPDEAIAAVMGELQNGAPNP